MTKKKIKEQNKLQPGLENIQKYKTHKTFNPRYCFLKSAEDV